jgi:tetratricopeptide (TPR) repeat protein
MNSVSALCLNMIVKNEKANIERCLAAVAPYVSCWIIGDTGSTDGTQDFIRSYFSARGIPGELHEFPFHNFEQARNEALKHAYASPLKFDYLLLDDADMELVVEDAHLLDRLDAPGYQLVQRSTGGLKYWNTRLVRREIGAWYHGVTHEYLDVPGGAQQLSGVWYRDHATGSNRVDKFERDIRLLLEALETEPENERHWFYLAQSYQDAGRLQEAADAYAKRASMGGWVEEAWEARLRLARCLLRLEDEKGFVSTALTAHNERPWRAEPLYDLARHHRIKGENHASTLFSERGLELPSPEGDILFVEDWVYRYGLREEFSIGANYARDPVRRARGFAACNALALDRSIPEATRDLALSNLHFYVTSAAELMPSFAWRSVGFAPPDGYQATNPSVVRRGEELLLVQRAVNYRIDEQFPEGDIRRYATPDDAPIDTRNFLLRLGADFAILDSTEIMRPEPMPEPVWPLVRGFEDLRPFEWQGGLWCVACVRELNADAWCEQALARIDQTPDGACQLTDWRVLRPEGPQRHEKNWMPCVSGDRLNFIYLCDPTRIVDDQARTVSEETPPVQADQFRGGSQLVAFDGGRLALIHEARVREGNREYRHRFVWFDSDLRLRRVTRPFHFHGHGVEFGAGLAWHPDDKRLIITYGVGDCEARIATVEAGDVRRLLDDAENLPTGAPIKSTDATARPDASEPAVTPAADPPHSAMSTPELFRSLAPFLNAVDSPQDRLQQSRTFDARIARLLDGAQACALPQIYGFYEVMSEGGRHEALIASAASMRAAGHPVRLWSYSPDKLEFLKAYGVELGQADDVVPRGVFDKILAGSEIRYFSDVFRYAVLYEYGGLWMDSDVVLLRPFPYRGEHFFNLQWRSGARGEHFVCGNVIYAKPYSRHLRALYELSIEKFFGPDGQVFGDVGPKLLSDYIASDAGAELRDQVFSPIFFNSIDWTEVDRFERPFGELADHLNDERVFGVHMWTARNDPTARRDRTALISMLSDPLTSFPSFTELADRFNTDKNRHTGNRHAYARVYDRLLSGRRLSMRRLMEIGLCRGLAEGDQSETPSVALWQSYFPFVQVTGVDLTDFSALNNEAFKSFVCDQSKVEDLRRVAGQVEPGSFDVIIDDGSHASHDEQLTLREFFPLLADGGWYFIEDLDWQPPGEDRSAITLTKDLLREIRDHGVAKSVDPLGVSRLSAQFAEILFFDSHYELQRARLLGGLVAIRKRGGSGLVR